MFPGWNKCAAPTSDLQRMTLDGLHITVCIVGATGSGSPGSGPFTTIRRYEELKGPRGPGVLGEEQKRAKLFLVPVGGF